VVAHRASSDQTSTLIANYLNANPALLAKTTLLELDSESEAFAVWSASESCRDDSIAIYIDGNTELLGKEVFRMYNFYFSEFRANVVYGDHYTLDVADHRMGVFNSSKYDESEVFMLAYRSVPKKYGRMIAFRSNAIQNVRESYLGFN
jgi:hypothetical protein